MVLAETQNHCTMWFMHLKWLKDQKSQHCNFFLYIYLYLSPERESVSRKLIATCQNATERHSSKLSFWETLPGLMVPEPLEIPGMNSYSPSKQIKSGLLLRPLKSNALSWLQGALSIPCWTQEFGKSGLAKELPPCRVLQRCGEVVWHPLMDTVTEGEIFLEILCVCYGNSLPADEDEAD